MGKEGLKTAIIIGAGPAGLTCAYELLEKTDIKPIIFEKTDEIGGISKTVHYNGNRMDMGGHRFFSKQDMIMKWWLNLMPLQGAPSKDDIILGREIPLSKEKNAPDPEKIDNVMLVRNRLSRIFYLGKFFNYPISLTIDTLKKLGIIRIAKIGASYLKTKLFPAKKEKSLEDFIINRFGKELYNTFFKDYNQKLWGVSASEIKPDWGAQRIIGLSITKIISHAIIKKFKKKNKDISQKQTETSLIEQFIYPKFGPGQLWEQAAKAIRDKGGELHLEHGVVGLNYENNRITEVSVKDTKTGKMSKVKGDYFFSTMPVKELINAIENKVPEEVINIANGLVYRDFITIGILANKLLIKNETHLKTVNNMVPDLWVYIQERDVKVGRLQIFNNWSPYLVKDSDKVWIGLEYFCTEGDELWNMKDADFIHFAIKELEKSDILDPTDVVDSHLVRIHKAYPAYFGTYDRFQIIRDFVDQFENLFLIGRNGQHRYNNMDHSMMSAMASVENVIRGVKTKDNIWSVNKEEEYHEEKNNSLSGRGNI